MDASNIQFTKMELQIIKYLFKHYKDSFNSRQLAKILEVNHAHANKLCNESAQKNLLKKKVIGNAAYFSFDYKSQQAINFITYLLSLEANISPKWLSIVLHNLKKFNEHIKLGIIFGSSVKNPSFNDIDVLLVYEKEKAKEISKIKEEITNSHLIEQPIRYLDVEEKDIFLNKDNKIFYNILSNNLIFHNAEKYTEVVKKCLKLKVI